MTETQYLDPSVSALGAGWWGGTTATQILTVADDPKWEQCLDPGLNKIRISKRHMEEYLLQPNLRKQNNQTE